jgi:hypothetical protein
MEIQLHVANEQKPINCMIKYFILFKQLNDQ